MKLAEPQRMIGWLGDRGQRAFAALFALLVLAVLGSWLAPAFGQTGSAPDLAAPAESSSPALPAKELTSAVANSGGEGAHSGLSQSVRFLELPAPWILVLVILPLTLLAVGLSYWRQPISRRAKVGLGALRLTALWLLIGMLLRPVWVESREQVFPPRVLLLVDDSASMRRQDAYDPTGPEAQRIASLGLPLEQATRLDIARAALKADLLPALQAGGYETRLYAFDEDLEPLSDPAQLSGRGGASHLGDALVRAFAQNLGRHVTDVVLLSDGRQNGGLPLTDAAREAAAAGIPVHSLVIGDTRPERNALLELVEAPQSALEGDELAFTVRVFGRGDAEDEEYELLLEELTQVDSGVLLDGAEGRQLSLSGERLVLVAPPGPGDAATGERRFRISLPPLTGETLVDDNELQLVVRVSPEKVRLLYVEGYPRWEYRRLALDLFKRADKEFAFQAWLASASPDFPQEKSYGLESLTRLPTTREELLERYDVILLGDVNPYRLFDDPADSEAFLAALRGFVEAGGGLLFQAGESDNPRAFLGTPLEDVLPIQLDPSAEFGFDGDRSVAFRVRLESPAAPHELVRLEKDSELNRRIWEEEDGLPGFYWYLPVTRAKPSTEVLLRHPSDKNAYGFRPLAVAGYFPAGRTLFLAFDSSWRWQKTFGPTYFARFWKGAVRWLALGRLRGGDRRFRLETTRSSYDLAERVVFEARVLDADFQPAQADSQPILVTAPDGSQATIELDRFEERPGLYRGTFLAESPGPHSAALENEGRRVASVDFEVELPSRENQDPSPDPAALATLAKLSNGSAVALGELERLYAEFPGNEERREPVSARLNDLWDVWPTLIAALIVLASEWILRKRLDLV
jgi:uncharacterized membrane protein